MGREPFETGQDFKVFRKSLKKSRADFIVLPRQECYNVGKIELVKICQRMFPFAPGDFGRFFTIAAALLSRIASTTRGIGMNEYGFDKRYRRILPLMLLLGVFLITGCGGPSAPDAPGVETPSPESVDTPETPMAPETPETETPETETPDELTEEELRRLFGSGRSLEELYYEMVVSGRDMQSATTRIHMKGERMRMEGEAMGQSFIMIYGEDAFYTLDPSTKTGMKMPRTMEADDDDDEEGEIFTLDSFTEGVDASTLRYVGKETVRGVPCHIVESREIETGHRVRMWLHETYGFPMKTETVADNGEVQLLMEVMEFVVGNVAEELFAIPDDYQILDLGSLIPSGP